MSNEVAVYQPPQRRSMMIKNLCPGLVEVGKIKIGNKGAVRKSQSGGDWQAPQKLDHFLITTNERGTDNNLIIDETMHQIYGESPKEIPVRLIYDDISLNFATRYICYYGKTVFCSGDGEEAQRLQKDKKTYAARSCPCGRQDPKYAGDNGPNGPDAPGGDNTKGKCKINGVLSVVLDDASTVGGVWKFRTTSYNSVVGILSSLALIQATTGGRLAGIPLKMTVSPKTTQDPIKGSQVTIYVVGLFYAGTMDTLRESGYQIALNEAKYGISMKRIEQDAMLMLSHNPIGTSFGTDSNQDVIEEFYPEEAQSVAPDLVEAAPSTVKAVAAQADADAPPLAAVTVETVDESTGEITTQAAAEPVKQRNRRTKAEIEADKQAAAVQEPVTDDGFPDPPGTVAADYVEAEEIPHPVGTVTAAPVTAAAAPPAASQADDEMGDLF